jgi:FHS family glucose/mannose:H+ symporter-like MFS transporter
MQADAGGTPAMHQEDRLLAGWRLPLLTYGGFILIGMVGTMLGVQLPVLSARLSLSDAQAGRFFSAQFLGSLLGVILSGRMLPRLGFFHSLAAGFLLAAAGVLGVAAAGWQSALACVFLYGIGFGILIPGINILVSQAKPAGSAAALNLLNSAWCLGAIAGPPLISLLESRLGIGAVTSALALLLGILGAAALAWRRVDARPEARRQTAASGGPPSYRRMLWLTAALIYLYVGVESALAGWIPSYAARLHGTSLAVSALPLSLLWLAILAGRLVAPLALRRVGGDRLVFCHVALALAGLVSIFLARGAPLLMAAVLLTGWGLSVVFPTAIAIFAEYLGARAASLASVVFALGGLGGASIPWSVGYVSARSASLAAGMLIPCGCLLLMLAIQLGIIRLVRRSSR